MKDHIKYKNIVAEFDGWELKHNYVTSSKCWFKEGVGHHLKKDKVFKYNKDWNDLIPVINKVRCKILEIIDSGNINNEVMEMDLLINSCMNDRILKIESTYKTILQFIKWYNENK